MKRHGLLLVFILILVQFQASAWGYRGHKIVAEIAKSLLLKNVADSVQYYLGETSFENASVWMDDIRSDPSFDYLKPMHYINIEKDKTYVKVSDPNILNELDAVFGVLQNRTQTSKEIIKQNLLILFHLVGDLHQPLHAGYALDKGGNTIDIDFQGTKTNLHRVWDTNIIESQNIRPEECLSLVNNLSLKEKKKIGEIDFTEWMNESRNLLDKVYAFKTNNPDMDYIMTSSAIIRKQIVVAGIRLASVLNTVFGNENKSGKIPAQKIHN